MPKTCRVCSKPEGEVRFEKKRKVCFSCRGKQRRLPKAVGLDAWLPKTSVADAIAEGRYPDPAARYGIPLNDIKRTVVLFDVHIPDHDPRFWKTTLLWLAFIKPNRLVLAGDFADFESASQHGGNPKQPKVVEDVAVVRGALAELRLAVGEDCEFIYLEGNHETRLARLIADIAPMLHGAVSFREMLRLDDMDIKWVPEDQQPIRIGTVKVLHGHQMRGGGKYMANKLVETYGESGGTVICGHFHRSQEVSKLMHPAPAIGMTFGCGRTLDPKWMGGPTGWQHRIGVLEEIEGVRTKVTKLNADDGVIVWGDRVFRAA